MGGCRGQRQSTELNGFRRKDRSSLQLLCSKIHSGYSASSCLAILSFTRKQPLRRREQSTNGHVLQNCVNNDKGHLSEVAPGEITLRSRCRTVNTGLVRIATKIR
jgi:hypothetical protein